MKKSIVLKVISIILFVLTLLSLICAATVTGGGFLDLSNIARAFFISVAIVFGILAMVSWKFSKPKN